jgi:hypothetical protein
MIEDVCKRADLLGISVYELINNYIFIFDSESWFYGVATKEDIDKYLISHDGYSDSIVLVDLSKSIDNLQVLKYYFLEEILEG